MQDNPPYLQNLVAAAAQRIADAGYNPATAPELARIAVESMLAWQRANLPTVEAEDPAAAVDPEHLRRLSMDLTQSGRVVTPEGDPAVLAVVSEAAYALRSAAAVITQAHDFGRLLDREGDLPVLPAAFADAVTFFRRSSERADIDHSWIDWSKPEEMKSLLHEVVGALQCANRDRRSAADLLELVARASHPDTLDMTDAICRIESARLAAEHRAADAERVVALWHDLQPNIGDVLAARGLGFRREAATIRAVTERERFGESPSDDLLVYGASRASIPERPAMWRALRDQGVRIISTWIDEAGPGETADLSELWLRVEREVKSADVVLLYAEAEDFPLKGAYHEAAFAIASGIPVIVVLPDVELDPVSWRPIGSWICHPMVHQAPSIDAALDLASNLTGKPVRRVKAIEPAELSALTTCQP